MGNAGRMLLWATLFLAACQPGGQKNGNVAPAKEADGSTATQGTPARNVEPADGLSKVYDAEGRLEMEGDMKDGRRHGVWTSYFPDGRVRSKAEYRDGKPEGITTVYRANGALYYTGQHRNGKEVGEWRFYDDRGELARTVMYDTTGTIINNDGQGR